jgi:hypothetical protein
VAVFRRLEWIEVNDMIVFFDLFSLVEDEQLNVIDRVLLHTGNYEVVSLDIFDEAIMSQLTQGQDIWTYCKKNYYTQEYCYYTLMIFGQFPNHKQYSDFIQDRFTIAEESAISNLEAPSSAECLVLSYYPTADEIKILLSEQVIDAEISVVDNKYSRGADAEEIMLIIKCVLEFSAIVFENLPQLLFLHDELREKNQINKPTQEVCRKYILDNYEVDNSLLSFIGVSPGDNGKVIVNFRTRYHEYILDTVNNKVVAARCKQVGLDY